MTYIVEINDLDSDSFRPLPQWIKQDDRELSIQTLDFDLIGFYKITVRGETTS